MLDFFENKGTKLIATLVPSAQTFVIISRGKELTRFSAKKALYLFGPFSPIRRVVLYILVSSIFNLFVILTILTNCILMTIQGSELVERTE